MPPPVTAEMRARRKPATPKAPAAVEPPRPAYRVIDSPATTLLTIEYVGPIDNDVEQALDYLRGSGYAEVVQRQTLGMTFDEACDVLRARAVDWKTG